MKTPVLTKCLVFILLVGGLVLLAGSSATAQTKQRPLEDFLMEQGDYPPGVTFVDPDPNFLGWLNNQKVGSAHSGRTNPVYFAGVDYAGLADPTGETVVDGSITERALPDGRAEVHLQLHTKNANLWVIEYDPNDQETNQINDKPTLFGYRPRDVRNGAIPALAETFLEITFINTAPGAPLPDLIQLSFSPEDGQEILHQKFKASARGVFGPFTAQSTDFKNVAEGTPGRCTILQNNVNPAQGVPGKDYWPAELIDLGVVGR